MFGLGEEINHISSPEELSQQSKVNPSANNQRLNKLASFAALVVAFLVIGVIYFVSTKSSHKSVNKIAANSTAGNHYTLEDNLHAIERMQQEVNKLATVHAEILPQIKMLPPVIPAPKNSRELIVRMNAPTTFINVDSFTKNDASHDLPSEGNRNSELAPPPTVMAGKDGNSNFLNANSTIEQIEASAIKYPDYTIAAGEFIPAVLETAIQSDLPGMVRAMTSRDVYALTGTRILIPKGSRLIGQYASGNIKQTQGSVLISWTRVQLPNGIVATINSPSADHLGRSGQGADVINHHFLARFSESLLFSVLGAAVSTAGVGPGDEYNSAAAYRAAVASSFQKTAGETLKENKNIQPTLHINQGAIINVFVARDISFYQIVKQGSQK